MERTTMVVEPLLGAAEEVRSRAGIALCRLQARTRKVLREVAGERSAQGTTEYAILVGVLVVIAILAIVAFRDKVSELWDDISEGINSL